MPGPFPPQRVLIVDDHPRFRGTLRSWLAARTPGARVAEANCGESGVDLARDLQPDLVLMDLEMPGIGGLQATRRLMAVSPGSRVVVVTEVDSEAHRREAARAGAVAYVLKATIGRELPALIAGRDAAAGEGVAQ